MASGPVPHLSQARGSPLGLVVFTAVFARISKQVISPSGQQAPILAGLMACIPVLSIWQQVEEG